MDHFFETNKKLWDAKTPIHLESAFYDVEGFKNGGERLNSIELQGLGDVSGKTMLHLQCHFGMDSMCWARRGAEVTAVDFSGKSIEAGRTLSQELNIPVDFLEKDVYSLPEVLENQYDIVFTSYGAICWLPDLTKWAEIITDYLQPGGVFFIAEFHPFMYTLDFDSQEIEYPYFNSGKAFFEVESGTYTNPEADIQREEYFWIHSLDETINALMDAGLQLEKFQEYDYSPYNCFPNMKERETEKFIFSKYDLPLPYVFSLKMKKPKA
ncbi:MAG: class I SAM-dependent methyltransferase [Saprospiraceae bacterium]|nr:class I SAM-dependent methyltransferase [Saprospiraceae bacterium]